MSKEPLEDCLKTFLEDVEVRRSTGELFEEACFSLFVQTANELGNVGNLEYQPARSETEDYSVVIVESALGLVDNTFQLKPILYPNPSDGIVSLDLRSNYNDVTIQLNDILGRQVMNRNYSEGKVFNLNITEEPGVYFLSVYTENRKVVFKLIIN